jgi:hypothetical protein
VVLETNARVFQRSVALMLPTVSDPRRGTKGVMTVASAHWVEAKTDAPAPPLQLDLDTVDARELYLSVNEGDNTPLPIERAFLMLPAYRVRFFRPEGSTLTLVYGRRDLGAPRYDLALLAPQVLSAPANEIAPEPESGRPQPSSQQAPLVSPLVFWAAMGLALAVLLGIIVRLLKSQPAV